MFKNKIISLGCEHYRSVGTTSGLFRQDLWRGKWAARQHSSNAGSPWRYIYDQSCIIVSSTFFLRVFRNGLFR